MQYTMIPTKVLNNTDKIQKNFIWGTNDTTKKLHLLSWSTLTRDKKDGGLGIRFAKSKNIVNLASLS